MGAQMGITLDGTSYRVYLVYDSLQRTAEIISGDNAGTMLSGRREYDTLGTGYTYQMQAEPDMQFPQDYNDFYSAITAPVESHEITLPFGNSTITFNAHIVSTEDIYAGQLAGTHRWKRLNVTFEYIEPQRTAGS